MDLVCSWRRGYRCDNFKRVTQSWNRSQRVTGAIEGIGLSKTIANSLVYLVDGPSVVMVLIWNLDTESSIDG